MFTHFACSRANYRFQSWLPLEPFTLGNQTILSQINKVWLGRFESNHKVWLMRLMSRVATHLLGLFFIFSFFRFVNLLNLRVVENVSFEWMQENGSYFGNGQCKLNCSLVTLKNHHANIVIWKISCVLEQLSILAKLHPQKH
jgi:hypothetical protein